MSRITRTVVVAMAIGLATTSCGSDDPVPESSSEATATATPAPTSTPGIEADADAGSDVEELYPDVLDVVLTATGDLLFEVDVTMSSPYDSPSRYADAWRVMAPDGTVLGTRELLHDHAAEQPFTRSLGGVEIPADVREVTVEGRDQISGWGGDTVTVDVPSD